jgi:DNA polymerase-3 subunit gamma/tau
MSYVVLARRYRPQSLDEIIGQEHVSRTLKNAIAENRVAHAYLFSGPRGVGKTTTARFMAKALNCKKGPTATPCGTCPNCVEIAAGSSMDVQEIDGASNRGIDEIRALRDNVKFAPASSKYKIYIIDEAHQITDAAFNALLKTLEEPPSHVVFILATTEPQKIPITILSRCQRYRFRLISAKEISATLHKIIKNEGFSVEEAALQTITQSAGGSMRDALSLLDQAISFTSGKVTAAGMQDLLGFLPKELITAAAAALVNEDMPALVTLVKDVAEQGFNLLQFARDLREYLRQILLQKLSPEALEISDHDRQLLISQQNLFSPAWLIRAGHLLTRALDEMRWSDQPRLILELALLRLAQPYAQVAELVERLEKLEKNIPLDPDEHPASRKPLVPPPAARPAAREISFGSPAGGTLPPAPVASPQPVIPAPETREPDAGYAASGDIAAAWSATVAELKKTRPIIGSLVATAVVRGLSGAAFTIAVSGSFQQEGIKRNQAAIEQILSTHFGSALTVRVAIEAGSPAAAVEVTEEIVVAEEAAPPPAQDALLFQVEGDLSSSKGEIPAGLEKIASKFPGKITKKK